MSIDNDSTRNTFARSAAYHLVEAAIKLLNMSKELSDGDYSKQDCGEMTMKLDLALTDLENATTLIDKLKE